jgi:clan AA aspartic protease (TIGR02281 family)
MNTSTLTLCALLIGGAPSFAVGQALTQCPVGQMVTDQENKTGVVISAGSHVCQVKYPDGLVYGWIFWNLRPAAAPPKHGPSATDDKLPAPAASPLSADPAGNTVPLPTILRPAPSAHRLVYRADPLGHFSLTAAVNGAPVQFLVDTGASLVTLTPADARVAGINTNALEFNKRALTANGVVRIAPVTLGEIRIEQLSVENVAAAVQEENLKQSLLGMSFLKRLKSFEMREGALTISW